MVRAGVNTARLPDLGINGQEIISRSLKKNWELLRDNGQRLTEGDSKIVLDDKINRQSTACTSVLVHQTRNLGIWDFCPTRAGDQKR